MPLAMRLTHRPSGIQVNGTGRPDHSNKDQNTKLRAELMQVLERLVGQSEWAANRANEDEFATPNPVTPPHDQRPVNWPTEQTVEQLETALAAAKAKAAAKDFEAAALGRAPMAQSEPARKTISINKTQPDGSSKVVG
jgi:hypothetical protein